MSIQKDGKLRNLADACANGACNVGGLLRSLSEAAAEIPHGQARDSVELKIIIGQISYLIGESLGPTSEALDAWNKAIAAETVHVEVPACPTGEVV